MSPNFLHNPSKSINTPIRAFIALATLLASLLFVIFATLFPSQNATAGGNTAPILNNVAVTSPILENHTATLTGDIFDPDVNDTFTLNIDWGEGAVMTYTYPAGTTVFTETHIYLDDNPTGTPEDDYTINLVIQDSAGGSDIDSTIVTVKNTPPSLGTIIYTTNIDEMETFTVTGFIEDLSPFDTFTFTIDWDDGTVITYTNLTNPTFFTITHSFVDDSPSGTLFDPYNPIFTKFDDDLGGNSVSWFTLYVHNVAPTLSNLAATSVDENGMTTLTGNISDPSPLDTFTLAVDWGDSAVMTYTYPAGTTIFTETHTYSTSLEAPLTPASYTLDLTLTDDDTGQDTATVSVNNAPLITSLLAISPVDENGITTLTGSFNDPDPQDTFTLWVDWGDGSVLTTTYPAGTTDFLHTHPYLDDNPSGTPSDLYTITVTLLDDKGGQDIATTTTSVANVAPNLTSLATTSPITEDDSTTLVGTFSDPGTQDTFTVLVNWGDGSILTATYPAGAFDFLHTHLYLDDAPTGTASDQYTITVTLMDDDGGADTTTTSLTVNNVTPTVNAGLDQTVNDGTELSFTGVFTDPGTLDTHTILWDFGDGNTITGTLTTPHTYTGPGVYTVTLTITDDDGGVTQDTLQVTVNEVSIPEDYAFLPVIHTPEQ